MLTIRRRGRFYHVRGSIRVGGETRIIKEQSTGCHRKEDAEAYRARTESEIRTEMLHGAGGRAQRMTIADAGLDYIARPGGVRRGDLWRLDQINTVIGDRPIARANAAFADFVKERCAGLAPATVARFRAVLAAAVNHAAAAGDFVAPKIMRVAKGDNLRPIRYLTNAEAERLIESYAPHVRPIATVLAFQGLRIGEAIRLDWRHVQWDVNALFIPDTKSGEPRTVTLQPRSRRALHALWVAAGSPDLGPRLPQPARRALCRSPGAPSSRRLANPACARDRLRPGRDRGFQDTRLAAPLGLSLHHERDRSRNGAP